MAETMIGVSETPITPSFKVPLQEAEGDFVDVRDDIFLRCLLVRGSGTFVVLVFDLIGFGRDFVARTKRRLADRFALDPEHVMMVATQNHSAPKTLWEQGGTKGEGPMGKYFDFLSVCIDRVVREAARTARPMTIGVGAGSAPGIGGNRRPVTASGRVKMTWYRPQADEIADWGVEDPTVEVVRMERPGDGVAAVLFHFACHPNTLWTTRAISADFPGIACRRVKEAFGGNVVPMFLNGFCGDVDPFKYMNVPRESFCSPEAFDPQNRSKVELCFRESQRFGDCLGREVVAVAAGIGCDRPCRHPASLVRAVRGLPRPEQVYDRGDTIEIHALRMCDQWAMIGLPLEPFLEIGLEIKRRSPFGHTFCLQETNGYQGYLPMRKDYPRGGYGVGEGCCNFEPGTAELVIDEAVRVLMELKNPGRGGRQE